MDSLAKYTHPNIWNVLTSPNAGQQYRSDSGNSPPDTGGVAAPSRKRCEATASAQTGWSGLPKCSGMRSLEGVPFSTTPSAPLKEALRLLLDVASTPPMPGGEWRAQFIQTLL